MNNEVKRAVVCHASESIAHFDRNCFSNNSIKGVKLLASPSKVVISSRANIFTAQRRKFYHKKKVFFVKSKKGGRVALMKNHDITLGTGIKFIIMFREFVKRRRPSFSCRVTNWGTPYSWLRMMCTWGSCLKLPLIIACEKTSARKLAMTNGLFVAKSSFILSLHQFVDCLNVFHLQVVHSRASKITFRLSVTNVVKESMPAAARSTGFATETGLARIPCSRRSTPSTAKSVVLVRFLAQNNCFWCFNAFCIF